mmetsp:Transcript_6061/g.10434  ORF Transcript_6061/g.10434 Transcript_6061/m.10434 type:complete len:174 (+) Transcript_6061:123-644(+)
MSDTVVLIWFVLDTLTHIVVEGAFVWMSFHSSVASYPRTDILVGAWREYGRVDKRWLNSDPTVVSVELITFVLDGILCLALMYAIAKRRPWRHPAQIILCVCELYGGYMTWVPEWLMGSPNLVTDDKFRAYLYLWFLNAVWVVIPGILLFQSCSVLTKAMSKASSGSRNRKAE